MKVYVKMSGAKSKWFLNLTKLFQKKFDEYNILPSKEDFVSCLFEELHKVQALQWLEGGDVIVWLEPNDDYIDEHWDNWEEEIKEYIDFYNEQASDYTGKIEI